MYFISPTEWGSWEKTSPFFKCGKGSSFLNKLAIEIWRESVQTTCYLINHLSTPLFSHKSPYQLLHNKPSTYNYLWNFDCLCYATNLLPTHKFDQIGIFVGNPLGLKGYRAYDLATQILFFLRCYILWTYIPISHSSSRTRARYSNSSIATHLQRTKLHRSKHLTSQWPFIIFTNLISITFSCPKQPYTWPWPHWATITSYYSPFCLSQMTKCQTLKFPYLPHSLGCSQPVFFLVKYASPFTSIYFLWTTLTQISKFFLYYHYTCGTCNLWTSTFGSEMAERHGYKITCSWTKIYLDIHLSPFQSSSNQVQIQD